MGPGLTLTLDRRPIRVRVRLRVRLRVRELLALIRVRVRERVRVRVRVRVSHLRCSCLETLSGGPCSRAVRFFTSSLPSLGLGLAAEARVGVRPGLGLG